MHYLIVWLALSLVFWLLLALMSAMVPSTVQTSNRELLKMGGWCTLTAACITLILWAIFN